MPELITDFHSFLNSLDSIKRAEFQRSCKVLQVGAGAFVYVKGSEADSVFLIDEGVIEILQISPDGERENSVAHLRRGDIFGELAILTNRERVASVRACEDCVLLQLEKSVFLRLLQRIPQFSSFLALRMADRLYKSAANNYFQTHNVDFSGSLHNLDLLLVFQLINSSGKDGELRLINSANDIYGSFFFESGSVRYAKFAHLEGVEAVWQLFLETELEGNFIFVVMAKPSLPFNEEHRVNLDGTDLLMQSASKRDIYQTFAESSKNLDRRLSRLAESLSWDDPATQSTAEMIWSQIERRPKTLDTIWRLSNLSWITLLEITRKMRDDGLTTLENPLAADPEE
jgi:CRP-like cAMP-binding protein